VFGIKESSDPVLTALTRNFYVGTEEELAERTRKSDMAFVVERLKGGELLFTESDMDALDTHHNQNSGIWLQL
jgi:hypothetical protein